MNVRELVDIAIDEDPRSPCLWVPSEYWDAFCEAVGRMDLFEHADFKTAEARAKNRKALNQALNQGFAKKKSAEWIEILNQAGVPCGPIYRMDEVFADPQVTHVQAAVEIEHRRLGKLRLINQPVKLSRTPAKLSAASPERGEHAEEVLLELGFDKTEIADLKSKGIV